MGTPSTHCSYSSQSSYLIFLQVPRLEQCCCCPRTKAKHIHLGSAQFCAAKKRTIRRRWDTDHAKGLLVTLHILKAAACPLTRLPGILAQLGVCAVPGLLLQQHSCSSSPQDERLHLAHIANKKDVFWDPAGRCNRQNGHNCHRASEKENAGFPEQQARH